VIELGSDCGSSPARCTTTSMSRRRARGIVVPTRRLTDHGVHAGADTRRHATSRRGRAPGAAAPGREWAFDQLLGMQLRGRRTRRRGLRRRIGPAGGSGPRLGMTVVPLSQDLGPGSRSRSVALVLGRLVARPLTPDPAPDRTNRARTDESGRRISSTRPADPWWTRPRLPGRFGTG
jgi:hypothetical protein